MLLSNKQEWIGDTDTTQGSLVPRLSVGGEPRTWVQGYTQGWSEQANKTTRYTHAHQVPHAEHMESLKMAKLKPLARQRCAVLCLSIHESASEVNCSGGDAQVVSCYCYLVIFHPFVEWLTVFHTSGLVLALSSIFQVLDLDLHAIVQWHPERHVPKGM